MHRCLVVITILVALLVVSLSIAIVVYSDKKQGGGIAPARCWSRFKRLLDAKSSQACGDCLVKGYELGLGEACDGEGSSSSTPSPAPGPLLGSAGILQGSGQTIQRAAISQNKIIPLFWQDDGLLYEVHLTAGKSKVTAAFDTGSTNFIVATPASSSTNYYDTSTGKSITKADGSSCVNTVSYVSQSNTVQVFLDTLSFPQKVIQSQELCTQNVTRVVNDGTSSQNFTISPFPVGATIKTTGASSMNVLGMAGVMQTEIASICKTFPQPVHVSPVIRSFAKYYQNLKQTDPSANADVVWSMMLGTPQSFTGGSTADDDTEAAGFIVFGPLSVPSCLAPVFTPMVPTLPSAPGIGSNPYQYYVVEVVSCSIGKIADAIGPYTKFPNFPTYLLVDTGTTLCLIPGISGAATTQAINNVGADEMVLLTLKGGVVITYQAGDVKYQSGGQMANVFQAMDDATAANFSTVDSNGNYSVGILGCTAMRNLYVEFNLSNSTIGFGQVAST
jgi:hypothetical protein